MNGLGIERKRAGLTQRLASKKSGIPLSTIRRWEQGVNEPDVASIIKLADLYGCTTDALLGSPFAPSALSLEYDGRDSRLASIIEAYDGMDEDGRQRLAEYADMLRPRYAGETAEVRVGKTA